MSRRRLRRRRRRLHPRCGQSAESAVLPPRHAAPSVYRRLQFMFLLEISLKRIFEERCSTLITPASGPGGAVQMKELFRSEQRACVCYVVLACREELGVHATQWWNTF